MREPRDPVTPGPSTPSPDEVRDLVRRIVDATLDGSASTSPAPVAPAASATVPGAASAAPERVAIAIGADHGGYVLKDAIGRVLAEANLADLARRQRATSGSSDRATSRRARRTRV